MAEEPPLRQHVNVELLKEKIGEFAGRAHIVFDPLLFPVAELDFLELRCLK